MLGIMVAVSFFGRWKNIIIEKFTFYNSIIVKIIVIFADKSEHIWNRFLEQTYVWSLYLQHHFLQV